MTERTQSSTSELHRQWARLENEHQELAERMRQLGIGGVDVSLLREQQAKLLLEINAVVAEIRVAPASTLQDYLALLDVAIEHEIDLVPDIAFYGATDFPMITRLLHALAKTAPGFEFNSLRRWLSPLGEFEQLMGDEKLYEPPAKDIEVSAFSPGNHFAP